LIGLLEIAVSSQHKLAPQWLRLAFHDAGTFNQMENHGGANGCLMNYPEMQQQGENSFLSIPINTLEAVKKNWESHPDTCLDVSSADMIQFAGLFAALRQVVVSPSTTPGLSAIKVNSLRSFEWGRDDNDSCDVQWTENLPGFRLGIEGIKDRCMGAGKEIKDKMMRRNGFTAREACALIGAHTIGLTRATFTEFLAGPWVPNGKDDATGKGPVFDNSYHEFLINSINATTIEDFALDISPFNIPFPDWFQVKETGPAPTFKVLSMLNHLDTDIAMAFPSLDETEYPNFHTFTQMYEQNNTLFLRDFFTSLDKMSKLGVDVPLSFPHPCDRCSGDVTEITFIQTIDLVRDLGNATAVGESQLNEVQAARQEEIKNATETIAELESVSGPPIIVTDAQVEEIQKENLIKDQAKADEAASALIPDGESETEVEIDQLLGGAFDEEHLIDHERFRRWRRW